LAEIYLRKRSIDICPASLRFNRRTPLGKGALAVFRPALIAAVMDNSGLVAVQRTFLDACGRRARDLGEPRRMLGRPGCGAVRLAAATDVLGLAEGVETALSATILLGIPVWAALGSERLAHVAVPPSVTRLTLLPDNDAAGRLAVPLAIKAHAMPGRRIDIDWPWHGLNDWNDALRTEREGEREGGAR
jgi:putative DNA primase/helicase